MRVSATESDGDDSGNSLFRIATVMNPRMEDNYKFPAGGHFMVLSSGKSHLRVIHDENKAWDWFLNIP